MEAIVYSNLVELLLQETDRTQSEIINYAIREFGFPEESSLDIKMQLLAKEKKGYIEKQGDKYHQTKQVEESSSLGRKTYLETLDNAPKHYFESRPYIKKLKEALEKSNRKK